MCTLFIFLNFLSGSNFKPKFKPFGRLKLERRIFLLNRAPESRTPRDRPRAAGRLRQHRGHRAGRRVRAEVLLPATDVRRHEVPLGVGGLPGEICLIGRMCVQ